MYFRKKSLALAVGSAVSGVSVGFAPATFAQDVADDAANPGTLEEVYVTGSRIRRPNLDSASPVTVLSAQELAVTGVTDIGSLLQRLPSAAGSPIGTTTNNGGTGAVQVDLRGMGAVRTLTLVNGKRTVDGGDYQTIPANMIERVEILKDGASAVYGADAVAGVVNIITRTEFEGIEIEAQTADWFDTDSGAQNSIGLIAGKQFDGGNVVVGVEYIDQEEAYQRDTPWDFLQDSFYIYPEGCENNLLEPYPTGCYRLGSSRIPEGRFNFANQGLFLVGTPASGPYQAGMIIPHDGRNYNYAPVNFLQTPYERTNIFTSANFDLTDSVQFKAEFRANNRTSAQELAPLPYDSRTDPGYNGVFNGVAYSGISEDNYYLRQAIDRYNAATGARLAYEPVVDARRRMVETNRRFEQDVKQYQIDLGLEGEIGDMTWDVFANRGYHTTSFVDFGQFFGPSLSNALGPSADLDGDGLPECYSDISDASTLIAGCVPLNLFGGGSVTRETGEVTASSLTQDMLAYVNTDLNDTLRSEQTQLGGGISGDWFELQGGNLGWALGFSYRKEEAAFNVDSAKVQDQVTGNTGSGTQGSLTNKSVFAEFSAPLFDNGEQSLTVDGGLRWDDFNSFDSETTYSLKVQFNPTDQVKLRATTSSIFRAPTLFEAFAGLADSFPTYSDPCAVAAGALPAGCAQVAVQTDSQVLARVGGNPMLRPETGDTFTAGVVWTPEIDNHNFSATVDYWKIDIEDGISTLGAQNILNQCHLNGNQDACALITRRPDYSVAQILDGALNVTEQGAEGIDVEFKWDTENDYGLWEADILWTHALERTKTAFDGATEEDLSGRYTDPTAADGGARPEDKVSYSFAWGHDSGLKITYLGEYIGAMDADTFCNCGAGNTEDGRYIQKIGSELYHDLIAQYAYNENWQFSFGITNVTDEAPPFIEVGFNGGTDPATYREFGRGYYFRVKWSQ